MKNPDVSLVVPVLNEELIIDELLARTTAALARISPAYEIIVVDDGSNDRTMALLREHAAKESRIRFLSLSRNFGHQLAIRAGLEHARGDVVAIMDGDLQDPPELIPDLYAKCKEGFDVVYARRRSRQNEVFWKKWAASLFYRSLKRMTRIDIPIDTGDFRLISRNVLDALLGLNESQPFIRGQIAWLGFRQTYVLYDRSGRAAGDRKYTVRKLARLALDGITSFSSAPLRIASVFGFLVSGVAFAIILYALWSKLIRGDVISGWTSLIISTMFIGGVQLICLGIIGEYIQRINTQVKHRPPYVIRERSMDGTTQR